MQNSEIFIKVCEKMCEFSSEQKEILGYLSSLDEMDFNFYNFVNRIEHPNINSELQQQRLRKNFTDMLYRYFERIATSSENSQDWCKAVIDVAETHFFNPALIEAIVEHNRQIPAYMDKEEMTRAHFAEALEIYKSLKDKYLKFG
ncbi:MAG: hypothetical protein WCP17_03225 [bacterium]